MAKAIKWQHWTRLLLCGAFFFSGGGMVQALAQTKSESVVENTKKLKKRSNKGPKKVMVSFDEDLVEGSLTGTELFLIMQKKQTQFGNLFELRENFIPEMYENIEKLK